MMLVFLQYVTNYRTGQNQQTTITNLDKRQTFNCIFGILYFAVLLVLWSSFSERSDCVFVNLYSSYSVSLRLKFKLESNIFVHLICSFLIALSLRKPYAPSIMLPRSSWTIPTKTRQEALADLPAELKDEVADLAAKFGTTSLDDSSEEPTRVPEPYRSCLAACGAHWPYGIQEEDEEITTKRPFRPIDIQFSDSSEDEDEVETVSSRDVVHSNRYFQWDIWLALIK